MSINADTQDLTAITNIWDRVNHKYSLDIINAGPRFRISLNAKDKLLGGPTEIKLKYRVASWYTSGYNYFNQSAYHTTNISLINNTSSASAPYKGKGYKIDVLFKKIIIDIINGTTNANNPGNNRGMLYAPSSVKTYKASAYNENTNDNILITLNAIESMDCECIITGPLVATYDLNFENESADTIHLYYVPDACDVTKYQDINTLIYDHEDDGSVIGIFIYPTWTSGGLKYQLYSVTNSSNHYSTTNSKTLGVNKCTIYHFNNTNFPIIKYSIKLRTTNF